MSNNVYLLNNVRALICAVFSGPLMGRLYAGRTTQQQDGVNIRYDQYQSAGRHRYEQCHNVSVETKWVIGES